MEASCCKKGGEMKCDMDKCMQMTKEECAAYCDSMKCSPEEKAMCVEHAGAKDMEHCDSECKEHGCKHNHEGEEKHEK